MVSIDILKKWKENNPRIENVVFFVSDSLRWDYLPQTVAKRGVSFRTVASSLFTASSFPSMVTGLYPHNHGVYSFFNKLPDSMITLLNLPSHNTSFYTENTWIGFEPPGSTPLHKMLRCKNAISLEKLDPPFVYLENEKGGHCPYGWNIDDIYKETECKKFFRDYSKKKNSELKRRYQIGINRSVTEFEKRIEILKKRKLLDSTLIIFLSDHGELLGEYGGIVGHGSPTALEVVYVPTVFIHPDLPKGISFEKAGVLRHVDLFPSIIDLLNIDLKIKVDGINIFNAEKIPDYGYTYWKMSVTNDGILKNLLDFELIEKSIWDKNGGYLYREGANKILRLLYTIIHITISDSIHSIYIKGQLRQNPIKMISNYIKILKNFCLSSMKFGSPNFDAEKSKELIEKIGRRKIRIEEKERIKMMINKLKMERKI